MRINSKGKEIGKLAKRILLMSSIAILGISCASDSSDDDETEQTALESPFLICATRNPGGVGFDFQSDRADVAYNLDEVPGLEYDLKIKAVKAYRKDKSGVISKKGNPYGELYGSLTDSTADAAKATKAGTLKGTPGYDSITSATEAEAYTTYEFDTENFSKNGLDVSGDGVLIYDKVDSTNDVKERLKKLAIGEKWKGAAKDATADNEPVWLIQTREGRYVKFIFTEFPATDAPAPTGYVAVKWELLE